jgi:hypothetical protein
MEVLQSSIARHAKDPYVKSFICVSAFDMRELRRRLIAVLSVDWSLSVKSVAPAKILQNSLGLS